MIQEYNNPTTEVLEQFILPNYFVSNEDAPDLLFSNLENLNNLNEIINAEDDYFYISNSELENLEFSKLEDSSTFKNVYSILAFRVPDLFSIVHSENRSTIFNRSSNFIETLQEDYPGVLASWSSGLKDGVIPVIDENMIEDSSSYLPFCQMDVFYQNGFITVYPFTPGFCVLLNHLGSSENPEIYNFLLKIKECFLNNFNLNESSEI